MRPTVATCPSGPAYARRAVEAALAELDVAGQQESERAFLLQWADMLGGSER
jgi:hypothetical protein